jgi:hypothetical protein
LTPTLTFTCTICGEQSTSICVYCTKDACPNHLCERCKRCSDCCGCDIRLEDHPEAEAEQNHAGPAADVPTVAEVAAAVDTPAAAAEPAATPEPVWAEPHEPPAAE